MTYRGRKAPDAGQRYVISLQNAYAKGRAAAEDPTIGESAVPYKRYEQRKSWLEGFRSVRSAAPTRPARPEPMW